MSVWAGTLAYLAYTLGAIVAALSAFWIVRKGDEDRPDRGAAIAALALTANWCFAAASFTPDTPIVALTEIARNLAWLFVLFRLFANDGRDESLRAVRPVVLALAFVEILQFPLILVQQRVDTSSETMALAFEISVLFRILVCVGAIVLLHNLYAGAAESSRRILRWNAAALAALWAFDLNFYTVAYLVEAIPGDLVALRGAAAAAIAIPFAIGFNPNAAGLHFRPSRAVTFRFLSLALVGAYLFLMHALASSLDLLREDMARLTQVGMIIAAGALALVWLPSKRLRGWLRVTAIKHLFKHRYDYRNEWIRFTNTIGRSGLDEVSLHERVVKAMADIADSSSGLLLTPGDEGRLELGARWHWSEIEVPSAPLPGELAALLERHGLILDFDEVRAGIDHYGELAHVPDWLVRERQVWAAVPLMHFDRLEGVVILARPAVERRLDWEDFDLLGIVGRQLASYLAEGAGQAALLEASRFDEFNRRMAFVMHDIKNLSSQMSLLLRNAERHADKPEFRKDMLVTVRNSADKLNALLARLGRYGSQRTDACVEFDLGEVVRSVAQRCAFQHPITMVRMEPAKVAGWPDSFDQALSHLVQNAIDATENESPVMLEVYSDGICGIVQVVDNGRGMTTQFVRSGLFKPFVSTKSGGFGIGAYEAREMIRAMGGRLDVESREELGTRFTISLPLSNACQILHRNAAESGGAFEEEVA